MNTLIEFAEKIPPPSWTDWISIVASWCYMIKMYKDIVKINISKKQNDNTGS